VPDDFCEFSTDALLRSDQKDRIEALVRGVQGGVFSPNEARNLEGLDSVEYGGEPRVQMQVVPLSAAANIPAPGPEAAAGVSHAAPEATKSYQAAVKSDLEALTARLKRPTRKPVIRKTKANGHAADFEK
jgi:hypothetical protein